MGIRKFGGAISRLGVLKWSGSGRLAAGSPVPCAGAAGSCWSGRFFQLALLQGFRDRAGCAGRTTRKLQRGRAGKIRFIK
jgi:hypothetical protein